MIKIILKTNTARKEVTAELTSTPAEVFAEQNIGTAGATVNLNGTFLTLTDINSTFEALGVQDSSTVNLNSVIKADGAAR